MLSFLKYFYLGDFFPQILQILFTQRNWVLTIIIFKNMCGSLPFKKNITFYKLFNFIFMQFKNIFIL